MPRTKSLEYYLSLEQVPNQSSTADQLPICGTVESSLRRLSPIHILQMGLHVLAGASCLKISQLGEQWPDLRFSSQSSQRSYSLIICSREVPPEIMQAVTSAKMAFFR